MAGAASQPHMRVVISGASSDIGQSLSYMVASGRATADNKRLELVLVDRPNKLKILSNGVALQLMACSLPSLDKCTCTSDYVEAFRNASIIFVCDGITTTSIMNRQDLLSITAIRFQIVGEALNKANLDSSLKILVVSEPTNLGINVIRHYAPSIGPQRIMGMSREHQNRGTSCIARMLNIPCNQVRGLTVWGNHSNNILYDVSNAEIEICGKTTTAIEAIRNDHFIKNDFNQIVMGRQADIQNRRKASPSLSVAKAAVQHMKEWMLGTQPETGWSSMVVVSDGSYNITEGVPYSFPVRVTPRGVWEIAKDLNVNVHQRERMNDLQEEITRECNFAFTVLGIIKTAKDDDDERPWSFGAGPVLPCGTLKKHDHTLD